MSLPILSACTARCVACLLRQQMPVQCRQVFVRPHTRLHGKTGSAGSTKSLKLFWGTNVYKLLSKQSKCVKLSLGLFPFSLFKIHKQDLSPDLCPEVLANIPKEVFSKEVSVKKKSRRNFLMRFIISLWEGFSFLMRVLRIYVTFGPLIALYPLAWLSHSFCIHWWNWMLLAMEYTGPTFIKLGQWAGTRRDIFSPEFCDMCTRLHDSTRQHAFYITKRKLRKAFGKKWRRIFEKIEKVPLGSGCIAQVHRAYMKADMIPDESVIQEVMSEEDTDGPELDFAEGFEILGFRRINDYMEDREDELSPTGGNTVSQETAKPAESGKEEDSVIETGSGAILDPEKVTSLPADSVEIITQMEEDRLSPIQTETETLIPVAVKVLHPGVYRQVQKDLSILRTCAWLAECLFPSLKWISVHESMEEFAELMTRQIDLRFEANNMERFVQNFEMNPYVRFPRPVRPYCKRSVLVETLENGEPMNSFLQGESTSDTSEVDSQSEVKKRIASLGVEALLQMIFLDNLVHGDLHPGNLMVQRGSLEEAGVAEDKRLILVDVGDTVIVTTKEVDNPMRLVILDTGITSTLSDTDRDNFKSVFTAVVKGEGELVAELMLKHARYSECRDVEGFKTELSDLVNTFREQTLSLGKIQVGCLLSRVFSTCCRHRVKMESNFASILLAIFVLEGLGRSLDPDLDILEKARPLLLG